MIIEIFEFGLLMYLSFSVLMPFILSIGGYRKIEHVQRTSSRYRKIAVFIPAYKEDAVILSTARHAISVKYPKDKFDVIIIADSLAESTIQQLSELEIQIVEVTFKQSTKSKASRAALGEISPNTYDIAVVLDADNIMEKDFLTRINQSFESGHVAIQGQRKAKNLDTPTAFLDGVSEAVNNHIYCKGASHLGLSSRLAGSGMAFKFSLFQKVMCTVDAIGGFDKELELKLTRIGVRIHYVEQAIIYDEKVRSGSHFTSQRSRWLSAQYYYLRQYFTDGIRTFLFEQNTDYLYKVLVLALPPRLVLPFVLFGVFLISFLAGGSVVFIVSYLLLLLFNLATFYLAVPATYTRRSSWPFWLHLFRMLFHTFGALAMMKKANREFIHTPHGRTTEIKQINQ
jgi:cellulose synthase/poly-beta-1,6-N-acetylglucosamine synthase-like glycosyltransferase